MTTFILASSSPRRRELLGSLGINFVVRKPSIDETQHDGETPESYVQRLSVEKAAAVAAQAESSALILAADTIVIDNSGILGKPATAEEACQMLLQLRDRTHRDGTEVSLSNAVRVRRASVGLRPFSGQLALQRLDHRRQVADQALGLVQRVIPALERAVAVLDLLDQDRDLVLQVRAVRFGRLEPARELTLLLVELGHALL